MKEYNAQNGKYFSFSQDQFGGCHYFNFKASDLYLCVYNSNAMMDGDDKKVDYEYLSAVPDIVKLT